MPVALAGVGFAALWRPDLWVGALALAAAYAYGVVRTGSDSPLRPAAFGTGLVALYAAAGSPVALFAGGSLFSARMLQDALLCFVAAPLLLLGMPPRWLRLAARTVRRPLASLTHPAAATVVFHGVLYGVLAPAVINGLHAVHGLAVPEGALLLLVSVVMWWPLAVDLPPELPRRGAAVQLIYLFVNWLLVTAPFALFAFGGGPHYAAYPAGTRALGLAASRDRQLAGVTLGAISHAAYLVALAAVFFRWARQEAVTASPEHVYLRLRGGGWSDAEARRIAGLPPPPRN